VVRANANARGKTQAKGKAKAAPPPPPAPPPVAAEAETDDNAYRIALPQFEGPLDLLLHLIQQHELDILDIPVSFITQRYLEYLNLMRSLSIDLASEYLVMAATLTHIKSKMLLPVVPSGQDGDGMPEEEVDPREELVRRLLEYQKYKAAAADLGERGTLGRDVFGRGALEAAPEGPAPFAPLGVFSLLDAFEKLLKKTNVKIDHEVVFDRISITDRIVELTERLTSRRRTTFEDLVLNDPARKGVPLTKFDIVITFLAILEMARMKLLRIYQSDPVSTIHLELIAGGAGPSEDETAATENETAASEAGVEVEAARDEVEAAAHAVDAAMDAVDAAEDEVEAARDEVVAARDEVVAAREEVVAPADGAETLEDEAEAPAEDEAEALAGWGRGFGG